MTRPRYSYGRPILRRGRGVPDANISWTAISGSGSRRHDDLVDAMVDLILELAEQGLELPKIHWIEIEG